MTGFDSPEVQAKMMQDVAAAFEAMRPAFEQIQKVAQQLWAEIAKIVREVSAWFVRWWNSIPISMRCQLRARSEPMMHRKMRRYALWCVQRR